MTLKPGWQGRFYEDFEVGDVYQHPLGRSISEADNSWFTLLTCNTNMLHFNNHYAQRSEFGRALVNSALSLAIVLGETVTDVSQQAVANLGLDEVRFTHPVFVGDTLYAETAVLAKRESASRPHAGIVTVRTRGLNQDGAECLRFRRNVMVYKQGQGHDEGLFPAAPEPLAPELLDPERLDPDA